jgi:hypothetical protein
VRTLAFQSKEVPLQRQGQWKRAEKSSDADDFSMILRILNC